MLHNDTYSGAREETDSLRPDVSVLLDAAHSLLNGRDINDPACQAVLSAAGYLEMLINQSNPDRNEMIAAMGRLTQAMAGF